jgi:death-on-curing protein
MSDSRIPDSEYVKSLHEAIFHEFRDSLDPIGIPGVKSNDMLESACMRPFTSLGGEEKYKGALEKLAALFYSLVMNHPFHDGNKRTALASLISGMSLNKRYFKPDTTDESIFRMVVSLAKNDFPPGHGQARPHADFVVEELHKWIKSHTAHRTKSAPTIPINKFLSIVREGGGLVRQSKRGWIIFNNNESIRISSRTKRLAGEVVKAYLSKLGLSEARTAIMLDERLDGLSPEKEEIRKYKHVLIMLAQYDREQEDVEIE